MDDKKGTAPLDNPDIGSQEEKSSGELEKLKNLFRSELKKAREEAEKNSAGGDDSVEHDGSVETGQQLIQDVEPIENAPSAEEPAEEIPEDMLCECCGEKARNISRGEDFRYCEDCYTAMKKYPYSWRYFLLAAAFIVAMVFSVWNFILDSDSYSYYKQGLAYEKQAKLSSAYDMYSKATSTLGFDVSRTQNITRHIVKIGFMWGRYTEASSIISSQFNAAELKFPHNKELALMRQDEAVISATNQAVYEIIGAYVNTEPSTIPYDELNAKLEAMLNQTTQIEEATDQTHDHNHDGDTAEGHASETTTAAQTEHSDDVEMITVEYNDVLIRYRQYELAVMCGKDSSVQRSFLEKAREADGDGHKLFAIYSYDLAVIYLEARDEAALNSVLEMYDANTEELVPLYMKANLARLKGDFNSAIALCEKANEINSDNYEAYRQMAVAYLLQGNYAKAYASARTAYENGGNANNLTFATCYTYIICAQANGSTADAQECKSQLESYSAMLPSYKIPDEVTGYLNGTVTAAQIYLEGNGEV
ncbi:MAG: tetratricopeptide repeat protein [Clostridiales bacterium]|nr:tetratricopeptide repeat protein [Clostridiales bacterium]